MNPATEQFKSLVEKLKQLGEDKNELYFWGQIFEYLSEGEQKELLEILAKELAGLESAEKDQRA